MATQKRKPKTTRIGRKPRSLRVLTHYVGKPSGGQWIHPGDYLEDDPKLFGLAEYLVEPMHDAIWIADIEYFHTEDESPVTEEIENQEVV